MLRLRQWLNEKVMCVALSKVNAKSKQRRRMRSVTSCRRRRGTADGVNDSCYNDIMVVHHNLKWVRVCVRVCVRALCCALGSAWPAGRGSSKVIVLKGIGGRVVRATPLTALGEGDVRRTNPKLLDSTQRQQPHQRTEEQRAGEKRETKQEREKWEGTRELERATESRQRNLHNKQHWYISIYTKATGDHRGELQQLRFDHLRRLPWQQGTV